MKLLNKKFWSLIIETKTVLMQIRQRATDENGIKTFINGAQSKAPRQLESMQNCKSLNRLDV